MKVCLAIFALASFVATQVRAQPVTDFTFKFGAGANHGAIYSADLGHDFEPGSILTFGDSFVTSDKLFKLSVAVPPGNYTVTVTLGDKSGESTTTVKAESRRLMLERIHTAPGEIVTKSFTVNVRTPQISTGGQITLDPRETGILNWDEKLTLQFSDSRPCVDAIEIHKAPADTITVFTIGDSTMTDQISEPYGTWAQQLPRWFTPKVAIANYGESGETLKAFRREHRWEKVMSEIKPGDYLFMQFGHNDLNKTGHNAMWPGPEGEWSTTYSEANTDYKKLLEDYATEAKSHGAIPVIVSPMTKINIRDGKLNIAGLKDYPQAAVAAAKEAGVACIDLNAMSIRVMTALGEDLDKRAYVDGLHTNTYGGYLLSRCIVEAIKSQKLDLAKYIVDDAGNFDPDHPTPLPDDFKIPLEPGGFRPRFGSTRPSTAAATMPSR